MSELSPAAQVVLDAAEDAYGINYSEFHCCADRVAAAALRAAADQVVPLSYEDVWTDGKILQYEKHDPIRDKLFVIADELESL